jgi:uncharacterized membrane protein
MSRYTPPLNDEQLLSINDNNAKFIYDNAINTLKEYYKSFEAISRKAETIFKYLVIVITGILSLYLFKSKEVNTILNTYEIVTICILIIVMIAWYVFCFLKTSPITSIYNTPERMLNIMATGGSNVMYLQEAIAIQSYAIPLLEQTIQKRLIKFKVLHYMSLFTIVIASILTFVC